MPQYVLAIWKCRYFWLSLVKMDLRARYSRSVLGLAWSLLQPISMTIVLCSVFHRLFNQDVKEYAPAVLTGLCFWSFISSATLQGCHCLMQGERYIRQHPAPIAIYPLRTVLGASFHFLMALMVVFGIRLIFAATGGLTAFLNVVHTLPTLLSVVPALVVLLAVGWSLAVLAAIATAYFPDTVHLAEVGLQVLFYATPIIYPAELLRQRGAGWFLDCNPLAAFVQLLRDPLVNGRWPDLHTIAVAEVGAAVVLAAATLALMKLERRIIFQL